MTVMLIAGALVGVGVALVGYGLFPGRPGLAAWLRPVDATQPAGAPPPLLVPSLETATERERRLGRALLAVLDATGLPLGAARTDLAITGQTREDHAARKAIAALLAGLLVPAAVLVLTLAAGRSLPLVTFALLGAAAAAVGAVGPDAALRAAAERRRRELRQAVSVWLGLVAISLAGGAGIEEASAVTAAAGAGWPWARMRHALDRARLGGRPLWDVLGELGAELGVVELRDLAAGLTLAGTEGARIRAALTAKADTLRRREASQAERDAAEATERLVLPLGVLLLAFVVFLGFPSLARLFFA